MVATLIILVAILVFLLYKYGNRNMNYWRSKGVNQLSPVPFLGDHYHSIFRRINTLQAIQRWYYPFKNTGFGGVYMMDVPFLIVTDPELLKQIMVKDSEYFVNRYDFTDSADPLFSRNLVTLKDEKWRRTRAVMTNVFTSAKMKDMFNFMENVAKQSVTYLESKVNDLKPGKSCYETDLKDFFSRYGTDVIASTAFGVEIDSFKNPKNEFFQSGENIRKLLQGNGTLKMLLLFFAPTLAKKFNITFFGEECTKFFISLVSETIKEREAKNIVRKDIINVLMEARKGKMESQNGEIEKGKLPGLTDLDITAQAIIFFIAGFETIASLLAFTCYELAINPDIQEKLQQEIDEVIAKENDKVTYDGVTHQMQYLNMCIHETLRKWPAATLTDRVCSKTYVIPKTDRNPEIVVSKGDKIFVPIAGLHYDPEYFPNPEKYDPERFRDEKATIKPFTFLAFGEGPRHCIGMRYALMEAKTILVHLLKKFTIVPGEKTPIPIKLSKKVPLTLNPEQGFSLGVKPRDSFYA